MADRANSTLSASPSKTRNDRQNRRQRSPDLTDRVVSLYLSGLTMREVADQLGIDKNSVWRRLIKAGVARRQANSYVKPKPIPSWDEYFSHRIEKDGDCLIWTGSLGQYGYGQLELKAVPGVRYAHRMSYFLAKGAFDLRMHVLHRCDVRACVNPDHLFLGNHSDNMRDMREKGRLWQPDPRGENNPAARLTEDQVREIRRLGRSRSHTQDEIASMFGISRQSVSDIVLGKRWIHVR